MRSSLNVLRRQLVALAVITWFGATALSSAQAQTVPAWPSKPVKLLVSFPPGAPGDVIVRMIQPGLQQALGQTVVIDNRPGAAGNLGAAEVARATDGHTFLVGPDTMFTINPHVYKKLAFKPTEDLVPVSWMARFNQTLVCNPKTGFKTVADFLAKARTEAFSYASGGPGAPGHMAMEMLEDRTGTKLTHVPYRGPAPAAQDIMGGSVACGFLATPVVAQQAKDGMLVALAVSGGRRSPALPAVPTVAEAGVAGFDASFYETLSAPRSTPPAVLARLQQAVAAQLSNVEVRAKLVALDLDVVASDPAESARISHADHEKWGKVNERVKLQLD